MGPKLMNCCRPEQVDTKEFGVPDKNPDSGGRKSASQRDKEQEN